MPDATHPETWRPIPDWEGLYSVSDHGRVRSEPRTLRAVDGRIFHYRGRVLRLFINSNNRHTVTLCRAGQDHTRLVAHLVAAAFIGPRPPGLDICHGDGDASNDTPANLRYDTSANNQLDQVRHGTHPQARKTHCPRSHPLIAPNLVPHELRKGGRSCLACHRAWNNAWYAQRTGRDYDFQALADGHFARLMAEPAASS